MADSSQWSIADMPDLFGTTVVVPGATDGLGFKATSSLAEI